MLLYKMKGKKMFRVTKKPTKRFVKMIDKEIRKLVPQETKQFTIGILAPFQPNNSDLTANIVVNAAVSAGATSGLQQGPQRNQRIGDVIFIKKIRVAWTSQLSQSATINTDNSYRFMIIQDKQSRGAVFQIGDLLTSTGGGAPVVSDFNVDEVPSRFRILYDKIYTIRSGSSGVATQANSSNSRVVKLSYKVPLKTDYVTNSTSTGVTAIDEGAIYAIWVCGGLTAAGTVLINTAVTSIRYTDA
jgi:hypothetical protein